MELSPDEVAVTLGDAMFKFLGTVNRIVPVDIDNLLLASEELDVPGISRKAHALVGEAITDEPAATVAHGFIDAWVSAAVMGHELINSQSPDLREANAGAFEWLVGQMTASVVYLRDWVNDR